MSLAEALRGMLALMPANQVLAEDIWLEVVVQDGQLEVKEAKKTQKVSTLLKIKLIYLIMVNSCGRLSHIAVSSHEQTFLFYKAACP